MNEDALRALVRESVARHLRDAPSGEAPLHHLTFNAHASH
jgi:hypothetical protein